METLVLTGMAFWGVIVGTVIAAIILMVLLEHERQFWSTVVFSAGFAGFVTAFQIPLIENVQAQPLMLAYYLLIHFTIGVCWSLFQWKRRTEKIVKSWMKSEYQYSRELEALRKAKIATSDDEVVLPSSINPGKNKDTFFGWIFFWPFSMLAYLCSDWLMAIWDFIYEHIGQIYTRISKRVMRRLAQALLTDARPAQE